MNATKYFCMLIIFNFELKAYKLGKNKQNADNTNEPSIIMAQFGSKAKLTCELEIKSGNITVLWKKAGLGDPLTKNDEILSEDKRYLPMQIGENYSWLLIRFIKETDMGIYECQVSNGTLSSSSFYNLTVKRAYAEILGDKRRRPKIHAPLRLSCLLHDSIETPDYIFWYKNDRVINFDLEDGATVREGPKGSELIFPRAEASHSGNYSCVPSNADQVSVIVEVDQPKTKS